MYIHCHCFYKICDINNRATYIVDVFVWARSAFLVPHSCAQVVRVLQVLLHTPTIDHLQIIITIGVVLTKQCCLIYTHLYTHSDIVSGSIRLCYNLYCHYTCLNRSRLQLLDSQAPKDIKEGGTWQPPLSGQGEFCEKKILGIFFKGPPQLPKKQIL